MPCLSREKDERESAWALALKAGFGNRLEREGHGVAFLLSNDRRAGGLGVDRIINVLASEDRGEGV